MIKIFKKIILSIFLLTFCINIKASEFQFNCTENKSLFPITFWYNSAAIEYNELYNFLNSFCFKYSDSENFRYFSNIILLRVNNHLIATAPDHKDFIHISNLVPFKNTCLEFFIDILKLQNRLDFFINSFTVNDNN